MDKRIKNKLLYMQEMDKEKRLFSFLTERDFTYLSGLLAEISPFISLLTPSELSLVHIIEIALGVKKPTGFVGLRKRQGV